MLSPDENKTTGSLEFFARSIKEAWRQGGHPDALNAFRTRPELLAHRSLVIDLAYEEYCLREEAGERPDSDEFCNRFPSYRTYLLNVIRGHRLLADHPEILVVDSPPAWPAPDDNFEGLTIVRELGRGAFSRAYLAIDPEAGHRNVVLKLSPVASGEAGTLGPLRHPNIAEIHWARRTNGYSAICMPYVGPATLGDVIEAIDRDTNSSPSSLAILEAIEVVNRAEGLQKPVEASPLLTGRESWTRAIAMIFAKLVDALIYLHRQGISHGDLKPTNVILGRGAQPYLIDFNLATGPSQSTLLIGGTLPYMPPERLRSVIGDDSGAGTTVAADVYSFGVLLFEVLTGRVPFMPLDSGEPSEIATNLLQQIEGMSNSKLQHPRLPRSFAMLVGRCLSVDAASRPTLEAIHKELKSYLARRGRVAKVLGVCTLCLALGGLLYFLFSTEPRQQDSGASPIMALPAKPTTAEGLEARARQFLATGDVAAAHKDLSDAVKLEPNGPRLAYLAYTSSRTSFHDSAVHNYRRAINEYRYEPAWVCNNLAFDLARCWNAESSFNEAEEFAAKALTLQPRLAEAHLNRAYIILKRDFDQKTRTLSSKTAIADATAVAAEHPRTISACHTLATVLVASNDPAHYPLAVQLLREAVKAGYPPSNLKRDILFKPRLSGRPDFEEVLQLPPVKRTDDINPFLINPFENKPESISMP